MNICVKTIFSRFQDVKGGKNFDINEEDISNVERDLRKYADIKIRSSIGEFRDFSVVLDELSKKWSTLSEAEQSGIAKAMAGTRQRENFLVLMNNMNTALDLQQKQADSAGSAMSRYGEYAKSTEAKMNDLKNTVQQLWMKSINSNEVNGFITGLNLLIKTFGNLPSVIGLATTALLVFKGKALTTLIADLAGVIAGETAMSITTVGLTSAFNALKAAFVTNPFGMIALGITTLVGVFTLASDKTEDFSKKISDLTNQMQEVNQTNTLIKNYKDLENQIESNNKVGKDNTELKKQQIELQKQLAQTFPSAVDGYTKENEAIISNIKNIEKLNEAKKNQILAESGSIYNTLQGRMSNSYTTGSGMAKALLGLGNATENSIISQYQKLVQLRDKALGSGNQNLASNYATQLTPIIEQINNFNKASIQLYSIGQKDVEYFDMASGKLVKYSDFLAQNTQATNDNSSARDKNTKSIDGQSDSQEKLKKAFDDITEKIRFYNTVLAEMNTKNGLSASSMKEIIKNHAELEPYLEDQSRLRDILSQKVKEEESNQINAYNKMTSASADYYNQKVRNNATAENAINNLLKQFVGNQGTSYNVDLKNFTNLQQLKVDATAKTVKEVAGIWARYYNAEAQEFNENFWRGIMDMSMSSNPALRQQASQMEAIAKRTQDSVNRMNGVINNTTLPKINFTPLNTEGISAYDTARREGESAAKAAEKAAEEAARKAEELRNKMKQNAQDVEQAITEIIKKEFEKRKQANEDYYNKQKEIVQKAKDLYNKQNNEDDYNKKLKTEQEKLNGLKASITNTRDTTSEAGKLRLRMLKQQEKEQQDVIDNMVLEHTRNLNNDMFDAKLQELDKEKEAHQKSLEEQYSDENISKMVNTAMITGQISGIGNVLDAYMNFQNKYNNGLTASGQLIQTEFIDKWKQVQSLINGTSGVSIGVNFGALKLPSYDVGTPLLSSDQFAKVHKDEAILPGEINPFRGGKYFNNFANLISSKTPNFSTIKNKNASVSFNQPLVVVQGNVDKGVDLEGIINRAKNEVVKDIKQTLNNFGMYEH